MRDWLIMIGGAFAGSAFTSLDRDATAWGVVAAMACFIWAEFIKPPTKPEEPEPEVSVWDEKTRKWRIL